MNGIQKQPRLAKKEERDSLILSVLVVWLCIKKKSQSLAQGDWLFFPGSL
jgi:hypothetical protein